MKSLVPAALVVVLEAGFLFSVALLPDRPEPAAASEAMASGQPARPPAAAAAARPRARS